MRFDLLIKNGQVIDPAAGVDGRADVAVTDGRVAAVAANIPDDSAAQVVDARGQIVTPGFIDLHTHVYRGATFWGIDPDPVASRTGVTTWVDAGSSGAFTVDGFRQWIVETAEVDIKAFLNISCIGLAAHDYELSNLNFCNPDLFALTVEANRDLIVGCKVRMGASTLAGNGFEPLRLAREALDRCGLPLMIHIAQPPPHPDEFVHLLKSGDVVTHCFTGQAMKLVDDDGHINAFAQRWLDEGVLLDLGHGTGSFTFESAERALAAGVKPYFVSSDIHLNSINGPMYDLPTCLDKLRLLGMTLPELIACVTARPARFIGRDDIGTLAVGSRADIAIFSDDAELTPLYDANWETRTSRRRLNHVATFIAGRRMERRDDPQPPRFLDWKRGGRDESLYAKQAAARSGAPVEPGATVPGVAYTPARSESR